MIEANKGNKRDLALGPRYRTFDKISRIPQIVIPLSSFINWVVKFALTATATVS